VSHRRLTTGRRIIGRKNVLGRDLALLVVKRPDCGRSADEFKKKVWEIESLD
jgi:hypothetical protein